MLDLMAIDLTDDEGEPGCDALACPDCDEGLLELAETGDLVFCRSCGYVHDPLLDDEDL
jgi:hypothetical protein